MCVPAGSYLVLVFLQARLYYISHKLLRLYSVLIFLHLIGDNDDIMLVWMLTV